MIHLFVCLIVFQGSVYSSRNDGKEIVDLEKFQLSSLKRESMDELFKMREEVISF